MHPCRQDRSGSLDTRFLSTAKLNGLNPAAYLRHVLERIADHSINRIDEEGVAVAAHYRAATVATAFGVLPVAMVGEG